MYKFRIIIIVILSFSLLALPCSALSYSSTYSDLTSTSSQVTNLINYAMNYDSFISSDYVCFRSNQYEYVIVWGDLDLNGLTVRSEGSVEYIRYYRTSTLNEYNYDYGTDSSFSLSSSHINTSNIDSYGFSSSVHNQYYHEYIIRGLLILIVAFVFCKFLLSSRSRV